MEAIGKQWRLALVGGILFLLLGVSSHGFVRQPSGLTAIWPCNAVMLALILLHADRPGARSAILIGEFVGSLLASLAHPQPAFLVLAFPIANTLESFLASIIVARIGGVHDVFGRVCDVLALMAACVFAPIIPGLIGAGAISASLGSELLVGWANWYGAAVLGMAVVTPGIIVGARLAGSLPSAPDRIWLIGEMILLLGLIAAIALIVFDYGAMLFGPRPPLLFVLFPFVTLATFRLRQFGAVASIFIITVIGARATVSGVGPIVIDGLDSAGQLLFLQTFLAMVVLTALPIAAALTERDCRAEEAAILADQYRAVVENIDKVVFQLDRAGRWSYLNPAWTTITGYSVAETLESPWYAHADGDDFEDLKAWATPVLVGDIDGSRRMLRLNTAANGVRWMELSLQTLRDGGGIAVGATGTLRDVDDRKRMEDHVLLARKLAEERAIEATQLAATDELTGLANRRAFGRHLQKQMEDPAKGRIALAIFDVDHFKDVNDEHGHAVGDRVLQRVASRALGVVRSGDLVGRLGGEEFGISMRGATIEDARLVAERLRDAIQASARDGEEDLPAVTVSVGVAAAVDGQDAAGLTLIADRALYRAKREGRNCVRDMT